MASDLEQVTEFYLVNLGQQVACQDCRPNSPEAKQHSIRLTRQQLNELRNEDIAQSCDFCGLPFFTRIN